MAEFQMLDEGNSEAQDRLATSFLLAQTSAGLARTGVLAGLSVAQTTTASGSVLIAAGASAVQASVGTGVALLVNDTLKTLNVFTTDPMGGLPRNDIVAFDSVTKAIIAIIGTPNASPTDPTVPATACALARLRHAASATTIPTAKIDDLRVTTRLAGVRDPAVTASNTAGPVPYGAGPTVVLTAPAVIGDGVKKFKITFSYYGIASSVPGDVFDVGIAYNGTQKGAFVTPVLTGAYINGRSVTLFDVPAAGSAVYTATVARNTGTGEASFYAGATAPTQLIVEQIA